MTKEDIFDKYSHVDKNDLGNLCGADYMDSNDFDIAADEYAQQQSIAFAEWLVQKSKLGASYDGFVGFLYKDDTAEKLYKEFIQSQPE